MNLIVFSPVLCGLLFYLSLRDLRFLKRMTGTSSNFTVSLVIGFFIAEVAATAYFGAMALDYAVGLFDAVRALCLVNG
jgi:hypothetical protein